MSEATEAKTTVHLFNASAKNKKVKTSFGTIEFDARGCALFEATEEQQQKLHALGWIGEPSRATMTAEEVKRDDTPREPVMLFCDANKGKEVKTSMGVIAFDKQGYATFDASAEDMMKFSRLGWLEQPQATLENAERAKTGKALRGPTIDEFVAAGYLPEEYEEFCTNGGYEIIQDDGFKKYKATGKGSWDERLIADKRAMIAKRTKEANDLREAQEKADKAKAELSVAAQPAPTPVAADPVPAPSSKETAKSSAKTQPLPTTKHK